VLKPTDLAVDERERLVFVLDAGAMDVKVFTYQGRLQQVFSGPGAGPGLLLNPTGIAVDPLRGEILVSEFGDSDGGDAAIEIFDYAGNAVDQISGAGRCGFFGCSGGFSRPQGVAVDAAGQIYLADMLLAQVLIFDRATKKIVNTLGGRDAGPPELRVPLDVALGAGGDVFVTSNRTGSVEVFRSGGTQP
jgi:DNA-binding beta-propeller fold protein YncE